MKLLPSHFALFLASSVLCAGSKRHHKTESSNNKCEELPKIEPTTLPPSNVWSIKAAAKPSPSPHTSLPSSTVVADDKTAEDTNASKIQVLNTPNLVLSIPAVTSTLAAQAESLQPKPSFNSSSSNSSKPAVIFNSGRSNRALPSPKPKSNHHLDEEWGDYLDDYLDFYKIQQDNAIVQPVMTDAELLVRFNKLFTPISTVDQTPFPVITMDPFTYQTPTAEKYVDLMWALDQANSVSMDFADASTSSVSDSPHINLFERCIVFEMGICIRAADKDGKQYLSTWRFEPHFGDLKKEMFTPEVLRTVSSLLKHDFDKDEPRECFPKLIHQFPQANLIREIQNRNIPVILHNAKKTVDHIVKYNRMKKFSIGEVIAHDINQDSLNRILKNACSRKYSLISSLGQNSYKFSFCEKNSFKQFFDTMYLLNECSDIGAVELEDVPEEFISNRTRNLPVSTRRTFKLSLTADVRAQAIQLVYLEMVDRIKKLNRDIADFQEKFYLPDTHIATSNNSSNSSSNSSSSSTSMDPNANSSELNAGKTSSFSSTSDHGVVQITLNATRTDSPALKPHLMLSDGAKFQKYFTRKSNMPNPPVIYELNKSNKELIYDDLAWALNQANVVAMDFEMTGISAKDHNVFQMGVCIVTFKDREEYISIWRIDACAGGVLEESMFSPESLNFLKEKLGESFVQKMACTMLDLSVLKSVLAIIHARNVPVLLHNAKMDLSHVAKIMGKDDITTVVHNKPFFTAVFDTKFLSHRVNVVASEKKRMVVAVGKTILETLVNNLHPMTRHWKFHDAAFDALAVYLVYQNVIERFGVLGINPLDCINQIF